MRFAAVVLLFVALAPAPLRVRLRLPDGNQKMRAVPAAAWLVSRMRRWTRRPEQADTIPQALELAARALRAGASLLTALEAVAAELPEAGLERVVRRVRGGLSLAEALDDWVGDRGERRTAAALLVLGHSSGAAMASSLDRAAASLRERRALSEEIRALTAQTRMSGILVAAAPAGFAAMVVLVDENALRVLFTTPVGIVSLVSGLVLEGLGLWWMGRLSRGVSRWA